MPQADALRRIAKKTTTEKSCKLKVPSRASRKSQSSNQCPITPEANHATGRSCHRQTAGRRSQVAGRRSQIEDRRCDSVVCAGAHVQGPMLNDQYSMSNEEQRKRVKSLAKEIISKFESCHRQTAGATL
jgi:hypothetical protein